MNNIIRFPLSNIFNVRDLGGYPINENAITKWGVFFRSGELYPNKNDIDLLYRYGVRTVIDLQHKCDSPVQNEKRFNYINIPLIDDFNKFSGSMYLAIVTIFAEYVKDVFNYIGEHLNNGGILFHCAAGKDRTGVIAALLLGLMGVSELDIITNYMVSAIYLRPYGKFINRSMDTMPSHPCMIEDELLSYLRNEHGDTRNYLKKIGVSDKILSNIYNCFYQVLN